MTDTLIATTARPVTFSYDGQYETYPAGTTVYAKVLNNGTIGIRVPGTLYTQRVYANTLLVP